MTLRALDRAVALHTRLLLAAALTLVLAPGLRAGDVTYVLEHVPADGDAPAYWEVEVTARGLDRHDGGPTFELSSWGDWDQLDGPYVELVDSRPNVRSGGPGSWSPELGCPFPSVFSMTYRVNLTRLGSEEQRRVGLAPTWSDDYAFGWTRNVLVDVVQQGESVEGKRRLTIRSGRSGVIVSGLGGRSRTIQTLAHQGPLDMPLAFGEPPYTTTLRDLRQTVEVFQFGHGRNATAGIAEVLLAVAPPFSLATGHDASRPVRAFVTDTGGGGMGSPGGLRLGVRGADPVGIEETVFFKALAVHELIHEWLGHALVEADGSLVWFKEGLTEYLALWQSAAAGVITRDEFAVRLLELEAIGREDSAAGQVAFGEVAQWRDGGPLEAMAYTTAPALALTLDAELRAVGQRGLPQLLRDLLARDEPAYDIETLARWFEDHGLGDRWQRSVMGTDLPDARATLVALGFRETSPGGPLTADGGGEAIDAFFSFRPRRGRW